LRASLGAGYAASLHSIDNVDADPINNQWNDSYAACFNYLKKMAPLQAEIVERRLSIFVIYANSILSAPEAALESRNTKNSRLWGSDLPSRISSIRWKRRSHARYRSRLWRSFKKRTAGS